MHGCRTRSATVTYNTTPTPVPAQAPSVLGYLNDNNVFVPLLSWANFFLTLGNFLAASPPQQGKWMVALALPVRDYAAAFLAIGIMQSLWALPHDDGDVEDNVEWGRIEALQEDSVEVQDYMESVLGAEQELIEAFQVFDENGTGTIPARKYFEILTEIGDDPVSVDAVLEEFASLGIGLDSEIDYRELAKYMASSEDDAEPVHHKSEVVIRDAEIKDGDLYGYAYAHPKLGEGPVRTSQIMGVQYDERATARVETRNTVYVVGPTGWKVKPADHPFNALYAVGEQIKVEWQGSWWDANVLDVNGANHLIHYTGFDSSWDEWVSSERMQKIV